MYQRNSEQEDFPVWAEVDFSIKVQIIQPPCLGRSLELVGVGLHGIVDVTAIYGKARAREHACWAQTDFLNRILLLMHLSISDIEKLLKLGQR